MRRQRFNVLRAGVVRATAIFGIVGAIAAGCGGGSTEKAKPLDTSAATSTTAPAGPTAAARWEDLTSFNGSSSTETASFTIVPGAIQWRVQWSCDSGTLHIESIPPPKKPSALADSQSCPKQGEGYSILTGDVRLKVDATGPWKANVQQQVDTPLTEAPLDGMDAGHVTATGDFYNIERTGHGTAKIYDLPDGRKALRLDPFEVSQNTDLYIWLSQVDAPHTTDEVVNNPYQQLGLLKATLGTENYILPDALNISKIGSIVIWCVPVRIAYIAATMAPPPPPS